MVETELALQGRLVFFFLFLPFECAVYLRKLLQHIFFCARCIGKSRKPCGLQIWVGGKLGKTGANGAASARALIVRYETTGGLRIDLTSKSGRLDDAKGEVILRDFAAKCEEVANLDKAPKLEGRNMSMFLSPKSAAAVKKAQKEAAKKQAEAEAAAKAEENN